MTYTISFLISHGTLKRSFNVTKDNEQTQAAAMSKEKKDRYRKKESVYQFI